MRKKIPVGVLGATGMVGQKYVELLTNHPWFEVVYVAASPSSAGAKYGNALSDRSQMQTILPKEPSDLIIKDVSDVKSAERKCRLVFSAFEIGDKETTKKLEEEYAAAGIPVFSNSSAHRWTEDVPMIIPEINPSHLDIISAQRKNRGWKEGFIIVKPNCSLQSYLAPVHALNQASFPVKKIVVTTMQAVSGAGYPGVPSLDMIDNVVPFINGEEDKTEEEPLKVLGEIKRNKIVLRNNLSISAHCNRVPVTNGHMACVSLAFGKRKPSCEQILDIWHKFSGEPQKLKLPFAPEQPIIYRKEENRPQPKKDRDVDKGMAVVIGRLRPCNVLDCKFVALSHNTVRGAAGGGILNAELALSRGLLKN